MRSLWRPVLDRVAPYDTGQPLERLTEELGLPALVRLSANENPLGPSPAVIDAIRREAPRAHLYPDGGSRALREALGKALGVAPEQVIIGNGADELLPLIAWAAFDPGDEVIVAHPGFEPYTTVITLAAAVVRPSPLAGYETDLDDMRSRVTERTKAIVLCSPHNPAGTIVRRDPLLRFLASLGEDSPLVVMDEAYRDFVEDPDYPDGVRLLERFPRVLVLRTFSKIAGLAGLRVGYGIGTVETIDRLNRVRAPYNVNRLAQAAALAALEDHAHLQRSRETVIAERRFLCEGLARLGFRVVPSQANFLLVQVGEARLARERLLQAGLLVRDGAGVGFPGHLRIAVGVRETNERLLGILGGVRA